MSIFCLHRWKEVRRTYTPPPSRSVKYGTATAELVRELSFGVTTVELRCRHCGSVKGKTLAGDVT